jgi:predicted GNAT family N-acyltransferase
VIKVKKIENPAELVEAFKIRQVVFVEEQQVDREEEYDGLDDISEQYLATINEIPAGTARWRKTPEGKIKLERFAVLKQFRKKGIGKALVSATLNDVPTDKEVYLNAQLSAVFLYEPFGFKKEGDTFWEANIEHYKMVLNRK